MKRNPSIEEKQEATRLKMESDIRLKESRKILRGGKSGPMELKRGYDLLQDAAVLAHCANHIMYELGHCTCGYQLMGNLPDLLVEDFQV